MKRIFGALITLVLALCLGFSLVGCDEGDGGGDNTPSTPDTPDTPDTPSTPDTPGGDGDGEGDTPTDRTYTITFYVNGDEYDVTVKEGEIPVFCGETSKPMSESSVYTFTGWNKEIVPATEDTTYIAKYTSSPRKYTVTYKIDGVSVAETQVDYGETPTPPETHNGKNAVWFGLKTVNGDASYDGEYTSLDPAMVSWAYDCAPMMYVGNYDRSGDVEAKGSALLYLALSELQSKECGLVRDRILESVRCFISGGNEPGFNAGPNHSYPPVALALAVIRHTESVWDELTKTEQEKIDLIMECFAIATAFVTDDDNYYKTGVALTGNYYKTWNPNHRHAMTIPIVAAVMYFSADGKNGADEVNSIFANFDYDSYIEKFNRYGFVRALYHWTAGGFTLTDGTYIPSSRELMMNGGTAYVAYADNTDTDHSKRTPLDAPTDGGYGVGIRGNTYTYFGIGLDNIGGILKHLYTGTYSGGAVISDTSSLANGTDKKGNPLAYIADGSKSPVEGELGMMKEFAAGDGGGLRSSASYNTHNFASVTQSLAVASALGYWTLSQDDPLFRLMWVGNTDLIYKNEVGYVNYSLGQTVGLKSDENYPYYLPWKSWWLENHGDAFTVTRDISYVLNGGSVEDATVEYERMESEQSFTLPTPTHQIPEVSFRGWYLDSAGTKTSADGIKIVDGKLIVDAKYFVDITLHAIFDYPASVVPKPITYHIPKNSSLPASAPTIFYSTGRAVEIPLPTLDVQGDFLGWYLDGSLEGEPLGDTLVLSAEEAESLDGLHLYAKYRRAIYQQKPGLLESISKTANTIDTTLAPDGSDFVTVKIPPKGSDAATALDTGKSLSFETDAITVKMTLAQDNQNPLPAFGVRLRGSANTSNFMNVAEDGSVNICGIALDRRITADPTTFTFVFKNHPTNTSGATLILDVYVDGVLVLDDVGYNTGANYRVSDIIRFYVLFGSGSSEETVRTMYIKDLTIFDGEAL